MNVYYILTLKYDLLGYLFQMNVILDFGVPYLEGYLLITVNQVTCLSWVQTTFSMADLLTC